MSNTLLRQMSSQDLLRVALADGACLVDSSPAAPSPDLKSVLVNRLSRYYARRGSGSISDSISLEETQFITAKEALAVVGRVQHVLNGASTDTETTDIPLIGTRDLGELRTLLSIVFKWGVDPLISKVILAWPSKNGPPESKGPRIIDLTTITEDYELVSSLVSELMNLLFQSDLQGGILQTIITTTMLNRHAVDLLRPCITLGWVPKYLASDTRPFDAARPFTVRFLNLYALALFSFFVIKFILWQSPALQGNHCSWCNLVIFAQHSLACQKGMCLTSQPAVIETSRSSWPLRSHLWRGRPRN